MAIAIGENFGKYRIIEPLGRGGMATVYKAYEAALDRYVALKVLPAEFLHEATFAARFEREAKVIAKLEHPNIIPIFAFGIEHGIPWMSMRLIRGGSLSGLLKRGQLPREHAVALVRAVADALTYAHAGGVVHRDVKPQNILVDDMGGVYLADFGIARMIEGGAAITRTGLVSGTPQYMAPEQATGHPTDHRVDIYALGVVTYELLTGSTPFSADTPVAVLMKQVSAPIPIPDKELVPESALGPLMKSLAKNPEERWQTAAEFAAAFEEGMGMASVAAGPVAAGSATKTIRPPAIPAPPTVRSVPRPAPPSIPPPVVAPRAGAAPATPVRVGIHPGVALAVAGLALFVAAAGVVAAWWWQRQRVEKPEMATTATLPPATDPTEAETIVPAAPAAEPRPGTPRPMLATAPAVSSTTLTPRPVRATAEPRAVVAESTTLPAEPVAQIVPPRPAPPPATTPTTPPAVPSGYAFHVNERTTVGTAVGPVHLKSAQFKQERLDEFETLLDFYCEEGKDQSVTYEVAFLDARGAPVLTIKDKKGIEEKDNTTFKKKQKIPPGLLDSVKTFKVTFSSVPD